MPAVTRIGDADVTHSSGMTRAAGSSNVLEKGKGFISIYTFINKIIFNSVSALIHIIRYIHLEF